MNFYYFHGFGSSPKAKKAQAMAQVLGGGNIKAPDFNLAGGAAVKALLDSLAADIKNSNDETLIVGSSLGGLYAIYVSALSGCRCLLLNPCLFPQAVIGTLSAHVNVDDIVLAQQLSLTAYASYKPENITVWVTKDDMLINHNVLTKPFFYKEPAQYRIFPKSRATGHEFKGFKRNFYEYCISMGYLKP